MCWKLRPEDGTIMGVRHRTLTLRASSFTRECGRLQESIYEISWNNCSRAWFDGEVMKRRQLIGYAGTGLTAFVTAFASEFKAYSAPLIALCQCSG